MKNINLVYDATGFLADQYEDGAFYIAAGEDQAITFNATFPAFLTGSVRAYIQFPGGGDVKDAAPSTAASIRRL